MAAEPLEDRTLLSATAVLQQGLNGYTGARDTSITSRSQTLTQGMNPTLVVLAPPAPEAVLLKWDLSATGISASSLQSVSITINVTRGATGVFNLYAMETPWDANQASWLNAKTRLPWDAPGATGINDSGTTVLGTLTNPAAGQATINLNAAGVALVKNWLSGPTTNFGLVLRSLDGASELDFDSSEAATVSNRPAMALNAPTTTLVVNAGPTQGVAQTSDLQLNGSIVYNDPAATQPLAVTWSVVSGPGPVTFSSPNTASTLADFGSLGTYVLQLSATDGILSDSSQVVIVVQPPAPDLPPTVSAGPNLTIGLNQTANLVGTARPNSPNPLTYQWSQLSGPGYVVFGTPTSLTTSAAFGVAGTYTLDLVATDGALAANSTVTVTVTAAPAGNQPPVVSAGANQTATAGTPINLSGTLTDDHYSGTSLTTTWQLANGPGTVTFGNASSLQTTATFSAAGQYYLRLKASDGQYTDQSYLIVTVNPAPPQTQTSTFQQGSNGYSGTTDTSINSSSQTQTNGLGATLTVGAVPEYAALFRWDLSASGITAANVQSASITLNITKAATGTYNLYALDTSWNANQASWINAKTRLPWETPGAKGIDDSLTTVLGTLTNPGLGTATINLNSDAIALLKNWLNGPTTNFGLILRAATGSGQITFDSSEAATIANRPKLSIGVSIPGQQGSG